MEWLTENFWLGWIGIAILLAAIEAATVDFVFLMFAGGALVGGVAAGAGAPFPLQLVLAGASALLLLFVVRPLIRRQFLDDHTDHHIGAAGLVGRDARVLQAVTDTDGNPNSNADSDANADRYAYSHTDTDGNSNSNADAHAYAW